VNDFLDFNQKVIDEFRANDGVCSGPFEGMPMMLLGMTGAKSGRSLTSPLVYSMAGDDMVIIASKAGAPTHPNWYHNLLANPDVTVEVGSDKYDATAVVIEGDDRAALYAAQAEQMPQFADYAEKAGAREIPVFRLVRKGA
jgi:deazaflavin-dependent oxidoreductase (nitroreductase family)